MKPKPKISIVIPTFNESQLIAKCLKSIFSQDYPKNKLEVIVVDNYSTDSTLEIARLFPVKILMNKVVDAQASKMVAFKMATGEFFIYLDADIELIGKDWFYKLLLPLEEENKVVGSFTRVAQSKTYTPITRYLSYDPFQKDPIFEFLSPTVESTVIKSKKEYKLCKYELGKIPPTGLCLFRRKALLQVWDPKKDKKYMELDSLVRLVKAGYTHFAYVPRAGFYHPFMSDLSELIKKRLKHIRRNYLKQETPREYLWVDMNTLIGKLKVLSWVVYATLIFPATIRGIYKSIKHKDLVCMYEPIVTFIETWIIIYGFVRYSFFR